MDTEIKQIVEQVGQPDGQTGTRDSIQHVETVEQSCGQCCGHSDGQQEVHQEVKPEVIPDTQLAQEPVPSVEETSSEEEEEPSKEAVRRKIRREEQKNLDKMCQRSTENHVAGEAKFYQMHLTENQDKVMRCLAKIKNIPTWYALSFYTGKSKPTLSRTVSELQHMRFLTKTEGNKKSIRLAERGKGWVCFNVRTA